MEKIQTQLKQFRLQRNLSQEQLAKAVGVTRQTINAVEQGKYQPTLFLAYKCAKLFEVPIEDLFTFKV